MIDTLTEAIYVQYNFYDENLRLWKSPRDDLLALFLVSIQESARVSHNQVTKQHDQWLREWVYDVPNPRDWPRKGCEILMRSLVRFTSWSYLHDPVFSRQIPRFPREIPVGKHAGSAIGRARDGFVFWEVLVWITTRWLPSTRPFVPATMEEWYSWTFDQSRLPNSWGYVDCVLRLWLFLHKDFDMLEKVEKDPVDYIRGLFLFWRVDRVVDND